MKFRKILVLFGAFLISQSAHASSIDIFNEDPRSFKTRFLEKCAAPRFHIDRYPIVNKGLSVSEVMEMKHQAGIDFDSWAFFVQPYRKLSGRTAISEETRGGRRSTSWLENYKKIFVREMRKHEDIQVIGTRVIEREGGKRRKVSRVDRNFETGKLEVFYYPSHFRPKSEPRGYPPKYPHHYNYKNEEEFVRSHQNFVLNNLFWNTRWESDIRSNGSYHQILNFLEAVDYLSDEEVQKLIGTRVNLIFEETKSRKIRGLNFTRKRNDQPHIFHFKYSKDGIYTGVFETIDALRDLLKTTHGCAFPEVDLLSSEESFENRLKRLAEYSDFQQSPKREQHLLLAEVFKNTKFQFEIQGKDGFPQIMRFAQALDQLQENEREALRRIPLKVRFNNVTNITTGILDTKFRKNSKYVDFHLRYGLGRSYVEVDRMVEVLRDIIEKTTHECPCFK